MECYKLGQFSNLSTCEATISLSVLIPAYRSYMIMGSAAVCANITCIVVFLSTKKMREKYSLFIVLSIGDFLNGFGMLLAGAYRMHLIYNDGYHARNRFECLSYGWPHFFLIGGQLPAFVVVVIGVERIFAVFMPMLYRQYATIRMHLCLVATTVSIAILSLFIGYLASFLNRDQCTYPMCSIAMTYGRSYTIYNNIIVIFFPITAHILNIITYIGAKRQSSNEELKRDLKTVLVNLLITTFSVCLITVPNILLWTNGHVSFVSLTSATTLYLYVCFCTNSTVNIFIYTAIKRDFRNQLLLTVSCGMCRRFLKTTDVNATRPMAKMRASISVHPF